jgi:hypothetical protein
MKPEQLDEIERVAKAAPQGKWEVHTSNSWRRVWADGRRPGPVRVIEPTVNPHDNHPDLMFGPGVKEWLEGVTPEVVLSLIAEVRHWKANHENQVARARFLVERGDIPLERVRAYEEMAELRAQVKRLLSELNDFTTAAGELNAEVVRLREAESMINEYVAGLLLRDTDRAGEATKRMTDFALSAHAAARKENPNAN